MMDTTNYRDAGIAKVRAQFDSAQPLTQLELNELVENRRLKGMKEEAIQDFIDSMVVGKTRFIFFMSYAEDPKNPATKRRKKSAFVRAAVFKIAVASLEEAIRELDAHGTFIEQDANSSLPRLCQAP